MRNVLMEIVQDDVNEQINAKEQQTKAHDIKNLMETLKLTLEQAMDALRIPQTDRATYTNLVNGI